VGLLSAFFKIWEGGIIFYGSALGGVVGYGLFYWYVLRRLDVSGWRLADAVAPLLAMGLAIGRIGCYLNGCCWGQVACEECRVVPLGAAHFPLLSAHARGSLVQSEQLQTTTGFTIERRDREGDPRARVKHVEATSAAFGKVEPGDLIVGIDGQPNFVIVDFAEADDKANSIADQLTAQGGTKVIGLSGKPRVQFNDYETYMRARATLPLTVAFTLTTTDKLEDLVLNWPRGKSQLQLAVERKGERKELPPFSPRSVGLYPTQLYETVSMVLLIFLLLAFYQFRRHDGQVMVLLMVCYSVHRFINESLRIEPSIGLGLTLSQWGSVIIFVAAVAMEIYLRRTMPTPPVPLPEMPEPAPATTSVTGTGPTPSPATAPATNPTPATPT
jgi:prolipoprotein diacylglyceryltransferase